VVLPGPAVSSTRSGETSTDTWADAVPTVRSSAAIAAAVTAR